MIVRSTEIKYLKATEKIQELSNIVKRQKKNKEKQALEDLKVKKPKEKGLRVYQNGGQKRNWYKTLDF